MSIRKGAPWFAAFAILGVCSAAHAGHFGSTKFSSNTLTGCDAQTNFAACQGQPYQVVYDTAVEKRYVTTYQTTTETVMKPVTRTTYTTEDRTMYRSVNETCYKQVQEVVSKPVCETVMKECRTIVNKKVCETVIKECPVTTCKTICEAVPCKECFSVCKQICETQFKEVCRSVCKPVTETVMKDVCREVSVPCTTTKKVSRTVTETVCEPHTVRGKLTWKEVPTYKSEFDPCTCTCVQKQCGSKRQLCREPDCTEMRQVTRNRTICEEVPVTTCVKKQVVEKVPTQVTRNVVVNEVVRQPVNVCRNARGAYVDASSLTGGPGTPPAPGAPTYDTEAPGRVFVEGLQVCREVTRQVTRNVPVTEIRRVPVQVTRCVPTEVVTQVPTKVTVMKQEVVTKNVPYTVCKQVPYTCKVRVPNVTTEMVPTCVTKRIPVEKCVEVVVKKPRYVPCAPAAPACPPAAACPTACAPACNPCPDACASGIGGGLRSLLNDPCRPKPMRDFFSKMCANRLACDPCPPAACADPCAAHH